MLKWDIWKRSKLGVEGAKERSKEGTGLAGGTEQERVVDDKEGKSTVLAMGQVSAAPQ